MLIIYFYIDIIKTYKVTKFFNKFLEISELTTLLVTQRDALLTNAWRMSRRRWNNCVQNVRLRQQTRQCQRCRRPLV